MGAQGPQAQDAAWEDLPQARRDAWLGMLDLTRRIEVERRDRLRRFFGWSPARFDAMAALHRAGHGLRMSELAAALVTSNGNVTALVNALTAEALAVRTDDEGDRRAAVVRLTRRGEQIFGVIAAAHAAWIDELLAPLDGSDLARLDAMTAAAREGLAPR